MILHSRPWLIRFSAALLALNVLEILPNCNAGDYSLNAVGGDSAWQTTEFTAHAELAPGTIVPIYAPFTFYVYYVEELSMGTRNVRNLQFMVDVHGDLYNNGGQVGLEGGSVNPFFTASGTSDGNVYDANGQIVGTADAPSYTSLHTYSPTYSGNEWLTVDIPVVVSFDAKPCLNPRAAGVLNPKVDSLNVSMSLGSGGNGSLRVLADTPNSALGSPKFLETLAVTSDFEVLKVPGPAADAGNLRQVLTPKALVQVSRDAEDGTNYLYKIDFYPRPPNPTKGADGFYIIPTGTNWFKEIQIENPTSGGQPDYSSLYVTETAGGISRQTQYSYSSTENKWTMLAPDSLAKETATVVSDTGSERVEEKSIYKPAQPADQLVAKVKNKFHLVGGAKLLVEETVNPDGMARTNTWTYGETSGQLEYKKVTKFIRFDSYWERYEYSPLPTGATYYQKKITPLNNATDTAAESLCRVIETVYYSNINGAGVWTVTEKVLSEVVSIKYKGRQSTSPKEIHEVEYATATIPTPWDSASAGNLLTTTTIDDFARPTTITYPNGTVGFFTYATPSGGLQTIETLGQPSSNGTAVQEGVKTITLVGPVGEMKSVYRYAITNGVDGPELSHDLYSYPIADDYFQISPTIQYLDGTTTSGSQCSCGFQSPQSTTDKDGTVTYYTYDTMNRQIATQTLGITTTNLLDSAGKTLATIRIGTNGSWNILQQTAYDVAGRISKSTNALNGVTTFSEGIDGNGYFVKTNGFPDGGTRIESYFKDGSLAKLTGTAVHPSRYVQGVELESNTNRFFTQEIKLDAGGNDTSEWTKSYYDMLKRRYKTVFSKSGTPYPFSQSFYNVQGQLWKQVDPDGVATLSQYNPKGELAYIAVDTNRNDVIDFAGNDRVTWTTNFVASKNGMTVLRTQRDVWPAGGVDASNLVSTVETSADGLRTWNILWNAGAGMTNQSQTVYAGSGNRYVTNTAPDGSYTLTAYSYGRLGSATRFSSTSAQLGKTTYTYDAHGRVLTTTDARNGATPYGYNNADQLTSVTTPPPGIGQGSQTTTTYFDNMGRATNVFLADLTTVTNEYYLTGELRKTFGSRSYPVGYGYDAQGRMKTMTNWTTFPNSGTRITTWNYDGYRGFLTNKVYDGGNAGPSYGYTPAGRLLSRAWARGITTTNSYNNNGDLSSTSYSDSTPSVAMGYDRRGRATTVTNGTAVCSLTFNDANQMLSETNSAGTLVGLRVTNIFDNFLRRTSVSALSSTSQLLSSNAYAFDYASRLTNVTDGTYSAGYTYLANSPLISQITLKSNTTVRMTTTKQYDYLNRLLSISSSPSSSSSLPLTYAYAYNDANQRTRVTLNDGSFWIYQYDSLGQVISSKKSWGDGTPVPGQQFEYGFDNIGNRTSTKAGGDQSGAGLRPATYSANSLNQYTSRTVPSAFDALGIATASASVTVNGSPADYRRGEYFQEMISVNNSSTSVWQNVSVTTSGALTRMGT